MNKLLSTTIFISFVAFILGCDVPGPIFKLTVLVKNETPNEVCIVEDYGRYKANSCIEDGSEEIWYFEHVEKPFFSSDDSLKSLTIHFLGDVESCYVFDGAIDSKPNDIRNLSSYEYVEQHQLYRYTITEELKNNSSPCENSMPKSK